MLTPEVITTCDDATGWYFRHYQNVKCEFGNGLWGGYTHSINTGFGCPFDGTGNHYHHSGHTWKYWSWEST